MLVRIPWLKWTARFLIGAFILDAVLIGAGLTYQSVSSRHDRERSPPAGHRVDIGGYALHLDCQGQPAPGQPTVILDAGAGHWSLAWSMVQPELARSARVCAYDRAGFGWSDISPLPRTSEHMAQELRTLLERAGIEPPYLLVGHSLGGWNMRLFAHEYPELVSGLVLVDSAHETQWTRLPGAVTQFRDDTLGQLTLAAPLARVGLLRLFRQSLPQIVSMPPDLRAPYEAALLRPETYTTMAAEIRLSDQSAAQIAQTGNLGDLPLIVVTASRSFDAYAGSPIPIEDANTVWRELQAELLALSSDSSQFISESASHWIIFDDPALVVTAVKQLLDRF